MQQIETHLWESWVSNQYNSGYLWEGTEENSIRAKQKSFYYTCNV